MSNLLAIFVVCVGIGLFPLPAFALFGHGRIIAIDVTGGVPQLASLQASLVGNAYFQVGGGLGTAPIQKLAAKKTKSFTGRY